MNVLQLDSVTSGRLCNLIIPSIEVDVKWLHRQTNQALYLYTYNAQRISVRCSARPAPQLHCGKVDEAVIEFTLHTKGRVEWSTKEWLG